MLRTAVAAARSHNRQTALDLLQQAQYAAQRLGRDVNEGWTFFGPTNVLLHRVHVAISLGDARQAVDYAASVQLERVTSAERRACLFIDVAAAYTQWGKHEKAY
jgi:hypothetical protein